MPEAVPSYEELFEWARQHSYWQWAALRRIVAKGELSDSDVNELVALAKHARPEQVETASTKGVIREKTKGPSSVAILGIHDIKRVNALAEGPITLGADGLTIVFGKNASGKSAVTRILKKACRAADPGGPILPSYHEEPTDQPASATIRFQVNGTKDTFPWVDGDAENAHLRTVHVFDLPSALSLVHNPNRLEYTPEIVQTLQALYRVTKRVAGRLEEEKKALGKRPDEFARTLASSQTEVARAFRAISDSTSEEAIAALTAFDRDDEARLALLVDALRDDPIGRARNAEEKAKRLLGYKGQLAEAATLLSDVALQSFKRAQEEASKAAEAASLARKEFASSSELADVGADAWKALWEAARAYSEQTAYPGQDFPVVDDARCVLCQQPIREGAKKRLQQFEEFVTSDIEERAQEARESARAARERLNGLELPRSFAVCELLGVERGSTEWDAIKRFIVSAYLRRKRVFSEDSKYPELPQEPNLDATITELETQATTLRQVVQNAPRDQLRRERDELADRKTLKPLVAAIRGEVDRLRTVNALDSLIQQCDTGRITRKARKSARQIITDKLETAFLRNAASLGFDTSEIEISIGEGQHVVHPWTMQLRGRPEIEPTNVLSEGERTCVALAGFLAELEASGNRSAIILDDPVSSLDHKYRNRVAKRLVEEAQIRQVVVFTHEIIFLYELRKHAIVTGAKPYELSLERGHQKHGVVREGAPWLALSVRKRVKQLRSELRRAEQRLQEENRKDYELIGEMIYKRLRQSWERAIEESLLCHVIQRFNTDVQTKRLRYLVDITDDDVQTVDREMTYCSDFVHDEAGPRTVDIPEPGVIREDLNRIETWISELGARRKKL